MGKKSRRRRGRGPASGGDGLGRVAAFWDEDANGRPAPNDSNSMELASWRCPSCGATWTAPVFMVGAGESSCPECAGDRLAARADTAKMRLPVIQIETGLVYANCFEAAQHTFGCNAEGVLEAALDGSSYGGFHWTVPGPENAIPALRAVVSRESDRVDEEDVDVRACWDLERAIERATNTSEDVAFDYAVTVVGPDAFERTVGAVAESLLRSSWRDESGRKGTVARVVRGTLARSCLSEDRSAWAVEADCSGFRAGRDGRANPFKIAVEVRRTGQSTCALRAIATEAHRKEGQNHVVGSPMFIQSIARSGLALFSADGVDVSGRARPVACARDAKFLAESVAAPARTTPIVLADMSRVELPNEEATWAFSTGYVSVFSADFSDEALFSALCEELSARGLSTPARGLTLYPPPSCEGGLHAVSFGALEAPLAAVRIGTFAGVLAEHESRPRAPEELEAESERPGAEASGGLGPSADGGGQGEEKEACEDALKDELEASRSEIARLEEALSATQDSAAHALSVAAAMTAERDEARARAAGLAAASEQAAALRRRVARLEAEQGSLASMEEIPSSEEEALELASSAFASRIAVLPNARESARAHDGDVREAWRVLRAMATVLWDLRYGEDSVVEGRLADGFRARTGFELSLHEHRLSRAMERERTFVYHGHATLFEAHVKGGGKQGDPLRAYFAFDDVARLVVIGHFGGHLRTHGSRRLGF